jgi:hypothetical protein
MPTLQVRSGHSARSAEYQFHPGAQARGRWTGAAAANYGR